MTTAAQTHTIFFGPKFTQTRLDTLLKKRFKNPHDSSVLVSHWDLSFMSEVTSVIFDLSLVEWTSAEQINFLFAWIRNVKSTAKIIKIRLPIRHELMRNYSPAALKRFETEFEESGKPFKDSQRRIDRRIRSSIYLMQVYGLFEAMEFNQSLFENLPPAAEYNKQLDIVTGQNYQIIPFTVFDISYDSQYLKLDTHFQDLINHNLELKSSTGRIFDLQNDLAKLLIDNYCYSPFESKILSNVVTQELYINALQHSFKNSGIELIHEAYVTVFLANKWDENDIDYQKQSFKDERYIETHSFFKDKIAIKKEVEKTFKTRKTNSVKPRKVDVLKIDGHFANFSFLEYSFLDFGQGIPKTLKEQFRKDLKNAKSKYKFSDGFDKAHEDTQIIEYALLLDTSKEPLDKNIEYYELVPRGLYFLVDMVRRYKGLMTIRSGQGMLVCDFSDQLYIDNENGKPAAKLIPTLNVSDAISHVDLKQQTDFPGTQFTIVIPEKANLSTLRSNNTSIPPVRMELDILNDYAYHVTTHPNEWDEQKNVNFTPTEFYYVSVLFIYDDILEKIKINDNDHEIHVKDIYNRLLAKINQIFDEHAGKNCLLMFDFAGLKSGNTSWIKVLYYLMITPKVNELTKVIIFNLPDDEDKIIRNLIENFINVDVQGFKKKLKIPEPYIYKPIPCIYFNHDLDEDQLIEWIGLKYSSDKTLLTNLLLGKKDQYSIELLESPENAEGSLFFRQADRLLSSFTGLEHLKEIFYQERTNTITRFLYQQVRNGIIDGEEKYVFLTSGGGYQFEYLSLFDVLHDKYMARFFAKCLLDDYLATVNKIIAEELRDGKTEVDYSDFRFDKIIAVTISSQLVATAIFNLLQEEKVFNVLLPTLRGKSILPTMIMLSSYYSFDEEKPFEKIELADKVLIVNDVISTGKLVKKMLGIIENVKKAKVNAVFSIADTRIPIDGKLINSDRQEITYNPENDIDPATIFTLANFDSGLILRKFQGPYEGSAELKRINPLLNTIVEFKEVHTENNKILFPKASGIIDHERISSDFFRIGHFAQNHAHVGYVTDLRPLFSSNDGYLLLEDLYNRLNNKYKELRKESVYDQIIEHADKLNKLLQDLNPNELKLFYVSPSLPTELNKVRGSISNDGNYGDYQPDFIFYPVFSGIEKATFFKLSKIFKTFEDNIIGLQRFETPKGWRFPVPTKRLNHLTYKKKVLILDTGSLTGDSLIQMIDTLCVLEVKEILVLSIITRTEDFSRELFSRIKSLKVKRLRGAAKHESEPDSAVVPADILFGISLQIPVYNSALSCPFCAELVELNHLNDTHSLKLVPKQGPAEYVKQRKKELTLLSTSRDELYNAKYLPFIKGTKAVDTKGIFNMRNNFGRIDTYRFYPDYFTVFNKLQAEIVTDLKKKGVVPFSDSSIKVQIEQILICILHEPHLIDLINNFLNDLVNYLKYFLNHRLFSADYILFEDLHYDWQPYSLLKLAFLLIKNEIFNEKNFFKILKWNDKQVKQLLHFQIWHSLYRKDFDEEERFNLRNLLQIYLHNASQPGAIPIIYNRSNLNFMSIIMQKYEQLSLNEDSRLDIVFHNLHNFLLHGQSTEGHFFLLTKLNELADLIFESPLGIEKIKAKLQEVLLSYENELHENLLEIEEDSNIKQHCWSLYSAISRDSGGILQYLERIKDIYHQIEPIPQERVMEVNELIRKDLKENVRILAQEKLFSKSKGSFFSLVSEYPVDLIFVLRELANRKDVSVNFQQSSESDKLLICINKTILEAIFTEIIENVKKCYKKYSGVDNLAELTCKYEIVQPKKVKLFITQNFPYLSPEHSERNGGLINVVEYFMQAFGGSYGHNYQYAEIGESANFEIFLEFKTYLLYE